MEMSDLDPEDILEKGRVPELIKTFAEINAFVSLLRCQICYQLMVSYQHATNQFVRMCFCLKLWLNSFKVNLDTIHQCSYTKNIGVHYNIIGSFLCRNKPTFTR